MKYSLKELFEVIDEKKTELEFYYDDTGELGLDYYIDLITYFEPNNEKRIIEGFAKSNKYEKIKNLDKDLKQIDVSGLLVYSCISHLEDFYIERAKDIKEVEDYMYGGAGISNGFTGDIIVLENGKRKKFFIKDFEGNILKDGCYINNLWSEDREDHEDDEKPLFIIEWES